jgi:DNA-binding transcriptional ArsR family regulator
LKSFFRILLTPVDATRELADLLKALANRRNRAVLSRLDEASATVTGLAEELDLSQATLCRALAELQSCGLVTRIRLRTRRVGRPQEYWSRREPSVRNALAKLEAIAADLHSEQDQTQYEVSAKRGSTGV